MIYIHIPFCRSFCTYCAFYSEIVRPWDEGKLESYTEFLVNEAELRRNEIRESLDTNTLYIGGGTPSVLPLPLLQRIVRALPYGPYEEFTIEVNPEDIVEKGEEYVRGLVALGVGRVSMGVQSFDDCTLRWMNRRHDSERAARAFRMLRNGGVGNISIDLIFGISSVSDSSWRETVTSALELGPQHISAYQLSIEEGSGLAAMVQDSRYREASEEQCRHQYDILCEMLAEKGYRHYEISNFALPGFEARHNSAYWARVPYVGLGAGAHSFDGTSRRWNSELTEDGSYSSDGEMLSEEDAKVERIMLSLRTSEGVDGRWLRETCGPEVVERLISEGALAESGSMVMIPETRFFVSDDIIRELI